MPSWVRPALVVAFIVGLIISIGDAIEPRPSVSLASFATAATPTFGVVSATNLQQVDVTGNVRVGDPLRIESPAIARIALLVFPARITFTNLRTGGIVVLADRGEQHFGPPAPWLVLRVVIEAAALALLLARGRRRQVVWLAVFLFAGQFSYAAAAGAWLGQVPVVVYLFVQGPIQAIVDIALFALALSYSPDGRTMRAIRTAGFVAIALLIAGAVAGDVPLSLPFDLSVPFRWLQAAVVILSVALFGNAARASRGIERRRVLILAVATFAGSTISSYSLFGGSALYTEVETTVALVMSGVMTVGLIYAVLVEQLFDIAFAINRTLVYGVITAALAGCIGLVDWFVKARVSEVHLATTVNAIVALALAIVFTQSRTFMQGVVERLLFASRYAAERHLKRVGAALALAEERASIDAALVDEARTWLRLGSVAVFEARDREFVRIAARGWRDADRATISGEDILVRTLGLERAPLEVRALRWHADGLPEGRERPTFAVPLFFRRRLTGFVLFGPHRDGTPLDPEERAIVVGLCAEAAMAYTALELQAFEEHAAAARALRGNETRLAVAPKK